MNKIFRIFPKGNSKAIAIGFLQSENVSAYTFRVQVGTESSIRSFEKAMFDIKSIYESGSNETYLVKTTNEKGEAVVVELNKSCFGGCG